MLPWPLRLLGMLVGLVMVVIGIVHMIPQFDVFGVFWTLLAVVITMTHAYGLLRSFGRR